MGEIISRKQFEEQVVRPVTEALKICSEDGYVCDKCYAVSSKASIEDDPSSFRRFYCWCDFESPAYYD